MERWALYNNEEWEIRGFAELIAPLREIRLNDASGNLEVEVNGADIMYLPNSRKLIFKGAKCDVMIINANTQSLLKTSNSNGGKEGCSAKN